MTGSQSLYDLIKRLADNKIKIWLEEGALKFKAPKGALTPELKNEMIAQKPALIEFLQEQAEEKNQIEARSDPLSLPISHAQQRLWFIDQFSADEEKSAYNIPVAINLSGNLKIDAFKYAIKCLVSKHEVLQTYFESEKGLPLQKRSDEFQLDLQIHDLSELEDQEKGFQSQRLIEDNLSTVFKLDQWPLFKLELIKLEEQSYIFLGTMHHIIADGWSMNVFVQELASYYQQALETSAAYQDEPKINNPLSLQYADYAYWQNQYLDEDRLAKQLGFWTDYLRDHSVLELPLDFKRLQDSANPGEQKRFKLDQDLQDALNSLAKEQGATLFMVLASAFNILLSRFSGQDDISLGIPVANRNRSEWESLIGFFVNTLVLRTDLSQSPDFLSLLQEVQKNTLAIYSHQDLPFDRLVEAFSSERDSAYSPLFQVMFSLQNTPDQQSFSLAGLDVEVLDNSLQQARYDMTWNLVESQQGIEVNVEYRSDLFAEKSIDLYFEYFSYLLKQIAQDPNRPVDQYLLQDPQQTLSIVEALQAEAKEYQRDAYIGDLFEQSCGKYSSRIALSMSDETGRLVQQSYGELKEQVDTLTLAFYLRGIRPGDRVLLMLGRSPEMIQSILALLKLGACYVPIDPDYPEDRKQYIVEDSAANILISSEALIQKSGLLEAKSELDQISLETLLGQADTAIDISELTESLEFPLASDQLPACIFYTSGSTGTPKGVIVAHRALVRLVSDTNFANYGSDEVVAHISNVCFDAASMEIWGALLNGGRLHIVDQETLLSRPRFEQTLTEQGISIMFLSMGLFRVYANENPNMFGGLKDLLIGGEAVDLSAAQKVLNSDRPPLRLLNGYGPTENCTFSTTYHIRDINEQTLSAPLGQSITHSTAMIADQNGGLLPPGIEGELVCGGDGLALGYLNNETLSNEKFVVGLVKEYPDQRFYKTGDLARFDAEGKIILSGRLDDQIKLRGFRIEPGEIQYHIESIEGVSACAVVLRPSPNQGEHLVAYVVLEPKGNTQDLEMIRTRASSLMPAYMLPGFFVLLESLPLNANGKVDRRALPDPDWSQAKNQDFVQPRNPLEEELLDIWLNILGLESISVHANFFDLGGHSLLATQLASRIYESKGLDIKVKDIFENPTIEGLAVFLKGSSHLVADTKAIEIPKVDRGDSAELSAAQRRLWFMHQMDPESSAYGMPMAIKITGALDISRLESSLQALIERHESLRTVFVEEAAEPGQKILTLNDFAFSLDQRVLPDSDELDALILKNQSQSFDLEKGPLFKAELLSLGTDEYVLLMNMHHIVSDGWSMQILQNDLLKLYQLGDNSDLSPLKVQYLDFAAWQNAYLDEERQSSLLSFWREELKDVDTILHLPTDRPRPGHIDFNASVLSHRINEALQTKVLDYCRENEFTSFHLGLSAYAVLLSKYSQQKDFCIGIPVSGRDHPDLEPIIGFFVNGLVVRSDLRDKLSLKECAQSFKERSLRIFAHQDMSADKLVEGLGIKPNPRYQPLAQVAFSHQSIPDTTTTIDGLSFESLANQNAKAKYDLILSLGESLEKGLELSCEYAQELFDQASVETLLNRFEYLLECFVSDDQQYLEQVSWYQEQEILEALNRAPQNLVELGGFEKAYPLSDNQQAIYLDALINPETTQNSIANLIDLKIDIDPDLWQQAFERLQTREVFRTHFVELDLPGEQGPYQAIAAKAKDAFSYHDLSDKGLSFEDIPAYLEAEAYCSYDITQDSLYHYSLYKLGQGHFAAMLRAHHIIFDGISGKVFLEEQNRIYEALINQQAIDLEPDNFEDFVKERELQVDTKACINFWRDRATSIESLNFDSAVLSSETQYVQKSIHVDKEHSKELRRLCRELKITPAIYFKTLYAFMVHEYCRPEGDFYLLEYSHGRGKDHANSYGVYYQQTPFIVPIDLFEQQDFDKDLFNILFSYSKSFHKDSRGFKDLSIQAQSLILPQGNIGFMYNYTQFETEMSILGKEAETRFLSPRAEGQVQFFVREHKEHFEFLFLFGQGYFEDFSLLDRLEALSRSLLASKPNILIDQDDFSSNENFDVSSNLECTRPLLADFQERAVGAEASKVAIHAYSNNGATELSYQALNVASDALAQRLIDKYGVKATDSIGLYLDFDERYLVALYAIIKAGASYVPLAKNLPEGRLQHISESAQLKLVVGEALFDWLEHCPVELNPGEGAGFEAVVAGTDARLYSIFTSGSTGLPKGAQVSHRGALNLLAWYEDELALDENDVSMIISAPGFDLTQKNLFSFLRKGGSLVLPDQNLFDPDSLLHQINEHKVTHINCAPSAFYALLEKGEEAWSKLSSLRWVVLGGEAIVLSELQDWFASEHCQARLLNSYGPTECSDVVCSYEIMENDFASGSNIVPIGRAINQTNIYVVDRFKRPLPPGLVGEIAIGGACLGLGYINQPKLNLEQFVELNLPFKHQSKHESTQRVYLSGDLGRVNEQGLLEYIGRRDFQIKLRGQRIELGEIEQSLRKQEAVRDALIELKQDSLVAYIVLDNSVADEQVSKTDLNKLLSHDLPAYMLPKYFVFLAEWPLSANGKIDRKALPDPLTDEAREIVKPRNDIEQALSDIWSEVLGVDEISIYDNFFELGGHSLLATRAVSRVKEQFQVEFPLKALFDLHTLADLAEYIKTLRWAIDSKQQAASSEADGSNENRDEGFL